LSFSNLKKREVGERERERERIHAKRAWIRAVVVGWSQESNDLILFYS
jgi:hypothetical protein